MKDSDTIKLHNVRNGFTIHMVIKPLPDASSTPDTAGQRPSCKLHSFEYFIVCLRCTLILDASPPSTMPLEGLGNFGGLSTPGSGGLGGLAGLGGLNMFDSNFMDLHAQMQNEVLSNPDLLRQILDNPLVQRIMTDPENMRALITSNPQMQELMEVSM